MTERNAMRILMFVAALSLVSAGLADDISVIAGGVILSLL